MPTCANRQCIAEIRQTARFCPKCGTPQSLPRATVALPAPSASFCSACHAKIRPTARFCPKCGTIQSSFKSADAVLGAAPNFCTVCGRPWRRDAAFCTAEGTSAAAALSDVAPAFCPNCGKPWTAADKQCRKCLYNLPGGAVPQPKWNRLSLAVAAVALLAGILSLWYLGHRKPDIPIIPIVEPTQTEKAYAAGNKAFEQDDFEAAVADYSKSVNFDPGYKAAYVKRGAAYVALLEYGKAREDYDKALALDAAYPDAYFARGTLFWLLGNLAGATDDYRHLVNLEKDDSFYYERLASVLYEQDRANEVEETYRTAYQQNPDREWALWGWLSGIQAQKNFTNALSGVCHDLQAKGVKSAAISYHVGLLAAGQKDYPAAITYLDEAIKSDPKNTPVYAYQILWDAAKATGDTALQEQCRNELITKTGVDPESAGTN